MQRRTRYARVGLLAAAVAVGAVVGYDCARTIRWGGGYQVQVRVERLSPRPVSSLSDVVLFRREWEYADGDPGRIDSSWEMVQGAGAEPFLVWVKSGGADSGLGREVSYVRQEVLVLRVGYADGGSGLVVAELPDGRGDRAVSVRVP
jgi:hypothetical protein